MLENDIIDDQGKIISNFNRYQHLSNELVKLILKKFKWQKYYLISC